MPSTITHEYHYRDVYTETNDFFKKYYHPTLYRQFSVGSQGHDALLFSHFWELHKLNERGEILTNIANNSFRELCVEITKLIKDYDKKDSKEIKLLLYGYIMHHILDSTVHPYIIQEYDAKGMHSMVESYIDEFMLAYKSGYNPHTYPVYKMIAKLPKLESETSSIIKDAFYNIYGIEDFGKTYTSALKDVPLFLRLFRYDPTGIKKLGYNIIDSNHVVKQTFSWLSYKTSYNDGEEFLNIQKRVWSNPIDANIKSTSSFLELYNQAVRDAAIIVSRLEEAIMDGASQKEISTIVPDIGAVHGLECGR